MKQTMTNTEIFQMRLRAFAPQMTKAEFNAVDPEIGYKDEFDLLPNVKYYSQDRKAACRVHFGHPTPCLKNFDYVTLLGDAEVSRLCIDPGIKGVGERMRVLHGLFSQVAQAAWSRKLYTSATADLAKVYTCWLGFEHAPEAEPSTIPPGDDEVHLLVLDLTDKTVQQRTKARLGWPVS